MYERPDVPKGGKHAKLIAIVALVIVAALVVVLVTTLWRLANEHSKLGDARLSDAVATAGVPDEALSAYAGEAGLVPTGNQVTTVLLAVVRDDDERTLSSLRLAALDETNGTARLVEIPAVARLKQDNSQSFARTFASGGAPGIVATLTKKGSVPVTHVVVMTESGWDGFLAVAKTGASSLKSKMGELLDGIVKSDMDTSTLVSVAQQALSSGASADAMVTVPAEDVPDDTGSHQEVDAGQIGLAVGTLATPQ